MISDLNETIKDMETVPLGRSKLDILFEALEMEWAASISKPTGQLIPYYDSGGTMNCRIMTESWNTMGIWGG